LQVRLTSVEGASIRSAGGLSMNGYLNAMRRYFEFGGRSSRYEFWFFVLFVTIASIVASFIDGLLFGADQESIGILSPIVSIVHLIPGIAVSVRRLHDIDRTGWWILLPLVSVVVMIVLLGVVALTAEDPIAGLTGLGMSMIIVGLVYLAVLIVLIVFYCTRGTPGPNRFGPEPVMGE
jgi:uncharacterized membrane protein YhaH (DUF805 family)